MLENLPAKRACRQIIPNITKPRVRKIPQSMKKGIIVKNKNAKKSKGNMASTTVTAITKNILRSHNKRIYTRHLRQVCSTNKKQVTQSETKKKSKNVDKTGVTTNTESENDGNIEKPTVEKNNIAKAGEKIVPKANVVQAIGKKTRRFVRKITQKLQSNKPFLSKKSTRNSDFLSATNDAPQVSEEPSGISENVDQTSGEENKETEMETIASVLKTKKLPKGTSHALLRKLSFRKSTKNKSHSECQDSGIIKSIDVIKGQDQENATDKAQINDNIISTNPTPAAHSERKVLKKRTFKKILNKLKEKANSKNVENNEETESQPDTAATTKVQKLTNNALTEEKTSNDNKEIVIEKVEDKSDLLERTERPLNDAISSLNVDILPVNLSITPQSMHFQVSPSTKKRSKKLNDCIAMLTGKLQEKLGKPFFESSENLDSALSRQSSTTDITTYQDNATPVDLTIAAATDYSNKTPSEGNFETKPPKRKTVTRKIIKKQSCDSIDCKASTSSESIESSNMSKSTETAQKAPLLRPPILKVSSPKEDSDFSKIFSQSTKPFVCSEKIEKINEQSKPISLESKPTSDTINLMYPIPSRFNEILASEINTPGKTSATGAINIIDDSISLVGQKGIKKILRKNTKKKQTKEVSDVEAGSGKAHLDETCDSKTDDRKSSDSENSKVGIKPIGFPSNDEITKNTLNDDQADLSRANVSSEEKSYKGDKGLNPENIGRNDLKKKETLLGFSKVDNTSNTIIDLSNESHLTKEKIVKGKKKGIKVCNKKNLKQTKNVKTSKEEIHIQLQCVGSSTELHENLDQKKSKNASNKKLKSNQISSTTSNKIISDVNTAETENKSFAEISTTENIEQNKKIKRSQVSQECEKIISQESLEELDDKDIKLTQHKTETKKYTRKVSAKRINLKSSTNSPSFEATKSFNMNVALDSAINLNEETQAQVSPSEKITLSSALSYSPPPENPTVISSAQKIARAKRVIKENLVTKGSGKNVQIKNVRRTGRLISKTRKSQNSEPCPKLTEVEEIVASFLSDDNEDGQRTQNDENSADKPIRLDGAEAILSELSNSGDADDTRKKLEVVENRSLNDLTVPEGSCKRLDKTTDQFDMSKCNETNKTPIVCKELSVSLVKLPDDIVNFKAGNFDSACQGLEYGQASECTSNKTEINETEIQQNLNIVASTNSDEMRVTRTSRKKGIQSEELAQNADCKKTSNAKEIKKAVGRDISPEKHEGTEKSKEYQNVQNFDETSISSNLKSQDGSETDVRPESVAKKQRRRRKNELAAIVADQLLESFKEVDKSKIDDLKMLENLAYEKSEDLLLTGMRLTPTTKRKIVTTTENKDNMNGATSNSKETLKPQKTKTSNPKRKQRSKSQPNHKSNSRESIELVEDKKSSERKDDKVENLAKKQKCNENINTGSNENLFRNLFKTDEPLKLNVEPLSQKHSFKISSNFNTTQFEVFSTFKNSFDTFRSLTDFSFMSRKDVARKSNFIPGSTETSNSVDSQSLKHDESSKTCDAISGDKMKSTFSKKLKKKFNRKKERAESKNINELRTGLESFSLDKETNQNSSRKCGDSKELDSSSSRSDLRERKPPLIAKSQFSLSTSDLSNKSDKVEKSLLNNDPKKPLLRPSILTATLEAVRTPNADAAANESTKPVSSRDPRLNKNKMQTLPSSPSNIVEERPQKKSTGPIRQRRKSEREVLRSESEFYLNNAVYQARERLRSFRRDKNYRHAAKENTKNGNELNCRSEEEEDNYLSQIAKSVNEKIMSSDDEGDGFEICINDSNLLLSAEGISRPATAMSTRSMPNFNDEQSNAEFLHEDDNTNTELIDMDLEDDMSIYTSFSQDVSRFTGKSKCGNRRRRRRSILFTRKPKKQNPYPDQEDAIFTCEICNKSFKKSAALSKHQMTITHISKLSEHEYLNASKAQSIEQEKPVEVSPPAEPLQASDSIDKEHSPSDIVNHSGDTNPTMDLEFDEKEPESVEELVNEGEAAAAMPVETEVPVEPISTVREKHPPVPPVVNLLNQPGIEPISSPEQVENNYDRYQNVSSRIALSQEERLFYECCNMLKGSETPMVERTYPIVPYSAYDVPNKPVTPKSSERFSYLGSEASGNFHHGTAYTVKSPMSHSRTSPRHAYPKIDVNQFSDISSDSNPAFPRAQPHRNLQSNLNYPPPDLANKTYSPYHHSSPLREVQNVPTGMSAFGSEVPTHNYAGPYFSGEGNFTPTQFPIATEGSTASLTARTFVSEEQAKDFNSNQGKVPTNSYPSEPTVERNQNPTAQVQ